MFTFLVVTNCILNVFFSMILAFVGVGVYKQKKQLSNKTNNTIKGVKK